MDALLIASSAEDGNAALLDDVEAGGIPVVLFDRYGAKRMSPGVFVDDVGGTREAMAHLLSLGYRRIAHLKGDPRFSTIRDRAQAYQDIMEEKGFAPLVIDAGLGERNGYDAMHRLLDHHRVEAVFAAHDPSAIGALQAILDRGLRVPEDVAVVGFGNIHCATHVPVPLTTVAQPRKEMGRALATLALECIVGNADLQTRLILPARLVVRRSCRLFSPDRLRLSKQAKIVYTTA